MAGKGVAILQNECKVVYKNNKETYRHQRDGTSCGVFIAMEIRHFLIYGQMPKAVDFDQANVPDPRVFMASTVMEAKYRSTRAVLKKIDRSFLTLTLSEDETEWLIEARKIALTDLPIQETPILISEDLD